MDIKDTSLCSVAIKLLESALGVATVVMLARILGTEDFGVFSLVIAAVALMALPAQMGLPTLVVRETSKYLSLESWSSLKGLWTWALFCALTLGLVIVIFGVMIINTVYFETPNLEQSLLLGLFLAPLISMIGIQGGILRGIEKVQWGLFVGFSAHPFAFLSLLLLTHFILNPVTTPQIAVLLAVTSAAAIAGSGWLMIRHFSPPQLNLVRSKYRGRSWFSAVWPMAITQGAYQLSRHTDIIMLGIIATIVDVGVYRVAAQGAMLVALGTTAIELAIAPHLASSYAQGNMKLIKGLVRRASRTAFLISFAAVSFIVLLGSPLIAWAFGADFHGAWNPLLVLAIGHLAAITLGPVSTLLTMSGNERSVMNIVAIGALGNIVLNLLLIFQFGAIGAAVATSSSLLATRIALWRVSHRKLGFKPGIL